MIRKRLIARRIGAMLMMYCRVWGKIEDWSSFAKRGSTFSMGMGFIIANTLKICSGGLYKKIPGMGIF
jgi:hypothetical protein